LPCIHEKEEGLSCEKGKVRRCKGGLLLVLAVHQRRGWCNSRRERNAEKTEDSKRRNPLKKAVACACTKRQWNYRSQGERRETGKTSVSVQFQESSGEAGGKIVLVEEKSLSGQKGSFGGNKKGPVEDCNTFGPSKKRTQSLRCEGGSILRGGERTAALLV